MTKLKFSPHPDHPHIEIGKTSGHEVNAVRVRNTDGSIKWTRRFLDSRLADHAISEAIQQTRSARIRDRLKNSGLY